MEGQSLQERYAPEGRCFGCGPLNELGLRIRSFAQDDGSVVAEWLPRPEHAAFEGILNGGILGTLMDCHSNWTAVAALLQRSGGATAPSTVTSEFAVRLRRPTPMDRTLRIIARAVEVGEDRVTVESSVEVEGVATASGRAIFVAVKPGHPAFGRW